MDLEKSEDEWLGMTPRMLVAALERKRGRDEEARRAQDFRIGKLAAAVYTAGGVTARGRSKRKPWVPADFFAWLAEPEEEDQPVDQQIVAIEAWNAVFGGRDLRGSKT